MSGNCITQSFSSCPIKTCDTYKCLGDFMNLADGRDKALKMAQAVFSAMEAGLTATGGSPGSIRSAYIAREFATAGRDASAFFNIFNGIIIGMIQKVQTFSLLMFSFWPKEEQTEVCMIPISKDTTAERLLGAGENLTGALANAAYIVAFGVMKPINSIHKYIPQVHMSETTLKVGRMFGQFMLFNTYTTFFSSIFGVGYQVKSYTRSYSEAHEEGKAEKLKANYHFSLAQHGFTLVEKSCEIVKHTSTAIRAAAPKWLTCSLDLVIAGAGIGKIMHKNANKAA